MKNENVKMPFVTVSKNADTSKMRPWLIRGGAFLLALVACIIFILLVGKGEISIGNAIKAMWEGTFGVIGNSKSMQIKCWDSAIFAAKLLCIAVALAPAFKMHFWNIGAEGQITIGALVTGIVMKYCVDLPTPLLFIVMILVCVLMGALWGVIPAFFKARFGTNETLFTLMMNYAAMKIMDYFYNDWKGLNSGLAPINGDSRVGWLPSVFGKTYGINIIVFVALAILMYFYMSKTKQGYELAVVGESQKTATYAGINVKKVIIRTMAISGAICGLCGGLTVAGQTHNIVFSGEATNPITNSYGFTAIIVAWLAKFNTLGMIGVSLLIVFLEKGTANLANSYSAFASGAGNVLIGIVLFFIIGSEFFVNYKLHFRRSGKEA